jgi:hypothetical protein
MDRPTSPMTADKWMQLKKIFAAAQGKPPAEQAEMVCALAEGDEELESAVRDLLAADESAGSFLQTPAADLHSALGHTTRSVSDSWPAGRGWNGQGLPRPGHAPGPRRRH